ncbi:MAG: glycosyl hydrolase [Bacteroidales bacterium]
MMKKIFTLFFVLMALTITGQGQSKSIKRGVAYGYHTEADFQTISPYVSWWYNWSVKPDNGVAGVYENYGIEFVPMAWNNNFNETELRAFLESHPNVHYLLGFNEPNFLDQARMTPSQAAAAWPRLEKIAADYGLELVGPAVNWCGSCVTENGVTYTDPYKYLDDFFAACPDCKVDYIAVHNYMCYSGALKSYLDGFKKYGKKIWLTEFACWDQSNITLDMQKSLVIGALDLLENDTMIFRYAWFNGNRTGAYPYLDLYKSNPGQLTDLGKLYMTYDARHDTSVYVAIPARIEAENYATMSGISLEATKDVDGGANVGWIDAGDWLTYRLENTERQHYYLYFRVASTANSSIDIYDNDVKLGTLSFPSTGGWQNWKTFLFETTLDTGKHTIKIYTPTGRFNLNWIWFSDTQLSLGTAPVGVPTIDLFPSLVDRTVRITVRDYTRPLQVSFYNQQGVAVLSRYFNFPAATQEIDLTGLLPGLYEVRIITGNAIVHKKIVKR